MMHTGDWESRSVTWRLYKSVGCNTVGRLRSKYLFVSFFEVSLTLSIHLIAAKM